MNRNPKICLLDLRGSSLTIWDQLRLEEALLRADESNWCLINWGTPPAIILGISGKVDELIDRELLQKKPLPLIRRCSGGGTVVVDHNSCFISFICSSDSVQVGCCPRLVHNFSAEIYRQVFPTLPFRLVENDYAIGEYKCGGNAQYLSKKRWLHHSSFLWDFDKELMDYLLLPKKMPTYRQQRPHGAFLCRLCDHLDKPAHFIDSVISALHSRFCLKEVALAEAFRALERPHRSSTTLL